MRGRLLERLDLSPPELGIELGPTRLRAYRRSSFGGEADAMEAAWDGSAPRQALDALRERFGGSNVIAVALDMAVLFVKRLELPPLSMEERSQMISLDPHRYFPVRDEKLVAGVREDDLVVAAPLTTLDDWLSALESLGSVERVEPTPTALVRHLAAHERGDGLLILSEGDAGDATFARFSDGALDTLRKVTGPLEETASLLRELGEPSTPVMLHPWDERLAGEIRREAACQVVPVIAPAGAPFDFAGAAGALLGLGAPPELTLSTPRLRRTWNRLGLKRALLHLTALAASIALLGWSVDHRRNAALVALNEAIVDAEAGAAPVLELQAEASTITAELALLREELDVRSSPLAVLLELTSLLPGDAYVTRLSTSGDVWELNGLARDAASLVPILERSGMLTEVRFRTATTRVHVANEEWETFSVLFRHVPAT